MTYSTKKEIKEKLYNISLDLKFSNFPVRHTGLRLVKCYTQSNQQNKYRVIEQWEVDLIIWNGLLLLL